MTGSNRNSVLHYRARRRAARALAGCRLHAYYDAILGEPLPAELKGLVTQLVALEASVEKSSEQSAEVLQLAPSLPIRQS
jgi:hypothetical protein